MSMLAERKRKTKWVVNPTKKPLWTTDSNGIKFGKDLMEKMGWSAGKGLGVNEQGIQEPLKISYKNDTKGMGFKGNDDDWIEQQDEFNELLNQLRNDSTLPITKASEEESVIKSLEEKSKQSKARVHYQKFTRGKDLSRYSDNDLACILGTNKMKKEKSKIEELNQTNSKVAEGYETSFGVTTVNAGSVQDYFKKKWILNKKSDNSSFKFEDAAEVSSENFQKSEFDFQKNGHNLMSGNEEEKFKKMNHNSDCENYLNINENRIFDSDKVENFENSVKSKKRKKEFQENNLEQVKIKKVKKNDDDDDNMLGIENMQKSEDHLINDLKYEESMSSINETNNCNSRKKRKKEKNQLQLDVTEDEKNYDYIAEGERQTNHENGCITEIPLDETLNEANVKLTLEEEITERKKKKKHKKEMLDKINETSETDNCILAAPLKNQNDDKVVEFCLEANSVEKMKKKKKNKEKYLEDRDFVNKYHNSNENEPFSDCNVEKTEIVNKENINGVIGIDDSLDINIINKKEKKKCKKEKLEEESVSSHIRSFEKFNSEEEMREKNTNEQAEVLDSQSCRKKKKEKKKERGEKLDEEEKSDMKFHSDHTKKSVSEEISSGANITEVNISLNGEESTLESQSCKKKKKEKRKDRAEKLGEEENSNMEFHSDHTKKSVSEEGSNGANITEVNISTNEQENVMESESYQKKNKKKHKKKKEQEEEKETEDLNCSTNHGLKTQMTENTPELESVKKKRKKDKKEKKEMDDSCDQKEKSVSEEGSKGTNITEVNISLNGEESTLENQPCKKKKEKRKDRVEKLDEVKSGKEFQCDHTKKSILEEASKETNITDVDISTNGDENALDSQSFKKKKKEKRKDRAEKLDEEKSGKEFQSDHTKESILDEPSKETNITDVDISTNEQENLMESESYQKKNKKKHKKKKEQEKEKETEGLNCSSNHGLKTQMNENTPELESVKKKRKKDKKEKEEMDHSCDRMEKSVLKEIFEETNVNNVNFDSVEDKSSKKKKDKKKFKQNKDESYEHLPGENNFKEEKLKKTEKINSKTVDKKINVNGVNKNSSVRFMNNNKVEEGSGVHEHKMELLNEKKADKFYPGQYTNERVVRLLSLSNIAAFKGSNLESVTGYGFLRKYETDKS